MGQKVVGTGRSGNVILEATNGSITLIGLGQSVQNKVISTYSTARGKGSGDISLIAKGAIYLKNTFIAGGGFSEYGGGGNILLQGLLFQLLVFPSYSGE